MCFYRSGFVLPGVQLKLGDICLSYTQFVPQCDVKLKISTFNLTRCSCQRASGVWALFHGARQVTARTNNMELPPYGLTTCRDRYWGQVQYILGGRQRRGPGHADPWHGGWEALGRCGNTHNPLAEPVCDCESLEEGLWLLSMLMHQTAAQSTQQHGEE